MTENFLSKLNKFANTDLQTGELRKAFNILPTIDIYKRAEASDKMGSADLGFGKELLENNKIRYLKKIEELAKQKDTWKPENLRKKEIVKQSLCKLPIFHFTTMRSLSGLPADSEADPKHFAEYNLQKNGLISGEKALELKGNSRNTNEQDLDLDRQKFVYASLGQIYMGPEPNINDGLCAIVLDGNKLKDPKCIVQDQHLSSQIGLKSQGKNQYSTLAESSMLGQDYLEVIATGIVTGVIDYTKSFPEIMFRDQILPDEIKYVLDSSDNENTLNANFEAEIEKYEKQNTNKLPVSQKIINVPPDIFYKMQDRSILQPDFTFKKGNNPWYKKLQTNKSTSL